MPKTQSLASGPIFLGGHPASQVTLRAQANAAPTGAHGPLRERFANFLHPAWGNTIRT